MQGAGSQSADVSCDSISGKQTAQNFVFWFPVVIQVLLQGTGDPLSEKMNTLPVKQLESTALSDEQTELSEIALDYRIKSYASIIDKYDRYLDSPRHASQLFNDVLGFRAFCDAELMCAARFPAPYA